MSRRLLTLSLRLTVSVGLLLYVGWAFEAQSFLSRIKDLQAGWVAAALGVSAVQVVVSAWRWRYTARLLGIELPLSEAVREYYLAMFITQLIPGGVTGDVGRAWRHAHQQRDTPELVGRAVRAVVIERASGQVVMTLVAIGSSLVIAASLGVSTTIIALAGVGIIVVAGLGVRWVRRRGTARISMWGALWNESRTALFSRAAFSRQMSSSLAVVTTYIAVYLLAAKAVGVETPVVQILPLVAPVLVTMLIPVTLAGWGVREAGAAMIWPAVGLASEDGIVASVTYGLFVLLSTLPGGLILAWNLLRGPAVWRSRSKSTSLPR